jgi:D-serine deaminase-like pyridoxal phosphate-dependent protein
MKRSVHRDLRRVVGREISEIPTPSLVIDRVALTRNIATLASWADGTVALRPHAKTHKCVEIARMQIEHGALGVTTATVSEAAAMAAADPGEILIANEIVGRPRIGALIELASRCRVIVGVDDPTNAVDLSAAAIAAGVVIDYLIDVDLGMRRGGVRGIGGAIELARAAAPLPGLRLRGVMGFEGHTVLIPDPAERAAAATEAIDRLAACVVALRSDGFEVEVVSAGGTNTHDSTGIHPIVTELQAGTYATMDHGYQRFTDRFQPTLAVASTVISRSRDTAVLDCGTKTVAVDVAPPSLRSGLGRIREAHEEHLLVDPEPGALTAGEVVDVRVGYAGGTINLHDAYVVVEGDTVVDIWPIVARGAGTGREGDEL